MTGLGKTSSMRSVSLCQPGGVASSPSAMSARSWPEEKHFPAPRNITQDMLASSLSASTWRRRSANIATVRAFNLSGRLRVNSARPPRSSRLTKSVMPSILFCVWRLRARLLAGEDRWTFFDERLDALPKVAGGNSATLRGRLQIERVVERRLQRRPRHLADLSDREGSTGRQFSGDRADCRVKLIVGDDTGH